MSAVPLSFTSWSQRWVLAWVDRYTRDIPGSAAADRREELASDLWEQGSGGSSRGRVGLATSLSIVSRALRGVPADLAWRRSQLVPGAPQPFRVRLTNRMVPAAFGVAVLVGLVMTAMGAFALGRVGIVVARHQFPPSNMTVVSTALATVALVCGLVMLIRSRTRWLGALWLAAATPVVLYFGGVALATVSATGQWVAYTLLDYPIQPIAQPAVIAAIAAVSVFYLALAIAWIPQRREA